jgi:sodium-dependent dicarboxylate transporter 2/3/5
MFRADIEIGNVTIPGWSNLVAALFDIDPGLIHDSTVAIFFAVVLFVTPVNLREGEFALDWEWARRIPWDVLLLFGGGLALARGFQESQLVEWLGGHLGMLEGLHPFFLVLSICLVMTFVTEMTSNTATTSIMLPILGGAAAPALGVNPLLLMIPAAISASCAFMMPVATPPNAIVFGGGRFTIPQMAKAGFVINLIGSVLVTFLTYFIAVRVFDIGLGELPAWAIAP